MATQGRHCEEHSCPPKPAFGRRRMRRSNPLSPREERTDCFRLRSASYGGQVGSLAMTASRHAYRSRGAMRPSFASMAALGKKRAQGRPGARCTRGLVCNECTRMRTRAYRFSGDTPAFPAQWFDGLFRARPGDQDLFVTVAPRIWLACARLGRLRLRGT